MTESTERPLRLEYRPVSELVENPRNWRRHPDEQRKALATLLDEVGWAGALLWNEQLGRLVDGHARKEVAEALDPATEVPVLIGSWDEATEAKILATLDPIAGLATTDPEVLAALVEDIDLSALEDIDGILARLDLDTSAEIRKVEEKPMPAMVWVLIAVPLKDYAEIGDVVRDLSNRPNLLVKTTLSDREAGNNEVEPD